MKYHGIGSHDRDRCVRDTLSYVIHFGRCDAKPVCVSQLTPLYSQRQYRQRSHSPLILNTAGLQSPSRSSQQSAWTRYRSTHHRAATWSSRTRAAHRGPLLMYSVEKTKSLSPPSLHPSTTPPSQYSWIGGSSSIQRSQRPQGISRRLESDARRQAGHAYAASAEWS